MNTTEELNDLKETAAHELGHVIGHIVSETNFTYVWVAGVNEALDKYYQDKDPKKHVAGHVRSYQHGKMTFDGRRVKCVDREITAEHWLLMLLAGIAGEEVFAGQEKPRSIIDLSHEYRQWESRTDSYGDFRIAQRWVKSGVTDGYIHAKDVWGVLQHYYNKAFYAVRDHKEFLIAAVPILTKKGAMYTAEVLTLWNGFYQIAPTRKESKKAKILDIKDNATEETPMNFTELETFILHDLSTRKVTGAVREDVLTTYGNQTAGVGGYNRFAYVDGRRYDVRGISKKYENVVYLLQRMGLLTLEGDQTVTAKVPNGLLPPVASSDIWVKDVTGIIDSFKKSIEVVADDPAKFLTSADISHVIKGYPVTSDITEAFTALEVTVNEINALKREESGVRQAADILKRDVSSFKSDKWGDNLRLRFVLELNPAALKALAVRLKKDYPEKPANYAKLKRKDKDSCGWMEGALIWHDRFVAAAEAGTLVDDFYTLRIMSGWMTAEAAHAAWRIEAASRHPDQGGSAELSAAFGAVWDRLEKSLPKAKAEAPVAGK